MEYKEIFVDDATNKEKIYTYLKRHGYSENYVKNLRKKEGYILLNGKVAHSDFVIKNGDTLSIDVNPNTKTSIMLCNYPLDIVYEDNNVLIINKPSGISTSASRSHYTKNISGAVLNYMLPKNPNFVVRIIGRLDKDTSGLIVIAKNSLSANYYSKNNVIKKTYYAIVNGIIDSQITIDKNIKETKNELGYNNLKREISNNGKPAITYVTPIKNNGIYTLCKINIDYGRTHQIRLHLASIGHFLLGDSIYGETSNLISHTALICKELDFLMYESNQLTESTASKKHLEVDFPDDFKSIISL